VQRNHSRIPAAAEGPGEQRLRTQHPKTEPAHHESIQATQTENLHPLPTYNQQNPPSPRHKPPPRKNTKTDPQRSWHTILQRRRRKPIHNLPHKARSNDSSRRSNSTIPDSTAPHNSDNTTTRNPTET
jgi:hypothetical protein